MAVKGKQVGELNQEELFEVADRTWHKEARAMYLIAFDSEQQRALYLRQSRQSRDTVHRNLKNLDEQGKATEDVNLFRTINKIYNYTLFAYDFVYQYVPEAILRFEYMSKISLHSKQMEQEAASAVGNPDTMREIAHDAAWYRNMMMHYIETEQHPQASSFAGWMKQNNQKIEDIVKRYMAKLKLRGPFNKLAVVQKLQVWNEIIKESGKATFEITRALNSLEELGVTVLLITASMIVFDILVSDHKPAKILKDGTGLSSSSQVDRFAVEALTTVCWWGKLPARYEPLPAEVVYGEKVASGLTAERALSYTVRATMLAGGAIFIKGVSNAIAAARGPTLFNLEEETAILMQDLTGAAEESAEAAAAAEAETSFIGTAEVTGLLEGELGAELGAEIGAEVLAEELMLDAAIATAPTVPVVAVAIVAVLVVTFVILRF